MEARARKVSPPRRPLCSERAVCARDSRRAPGSPYDPRMCPPGRPPSLSIRSQAGCCRSQEPAFDALATKCCGALGSCGSRGGARPKGESPAPSLAPSVHYVPEIHGARLVHHTTLVCALQVAPPLYPSGHRQEPAFDALATKCCGGLGSRGGARPKGESPAPSLAPSAQDVPEIHGARLVHHTTLICPPGRPHVRGQGVQPHSAPRGARALAEV